VVAKFGLQVRSNAHVANNSGDDVDGEMLNQRGQTTHVLADLHMLDAQFQITKMVNESFTKIDGL
jgi:hypothetical protein